MIATRILPLLLVEITSSLSLSTYSSRDSKSDDEIASELDNVGKGHHSYKTQLALAFEELMRSFQRGQPTLIHIPKTAGTGIEDAGKEAGVPWGRFLTGGQQMMPGPSVCSKHHVPPALFEPVQENWNADDAFCVVRNPYDRIVSEYSYRLSVAGVPRYFLPKEHTCLPEGLNYFVQQAMLAYVSGKPFAFDCHLLPQVEYVAGGGKHWCGNTLKMEDLPDNFNQLMEARGVPVRLPEDKKSFSFDSRCQALSVEDLSDVSKAMIDIVYEEDFKMVDGQEPKATSESFVGEGSSYADATFYAASSLKAKVYAAYEQGAEARPPVDPVPENNAEAALQLWLASTKGNPRSNAEAGVQALTLDPAGLKHIA